MIQSTPRDPQTSLEDLTEDELALDPDDPIEPPDGGATDGGSDPQTAAPPADN